MAQLDAGVVAALLGCLDRLLAGAQTVAFGDEVLERRVPLGQRAGQRMVRRQRAERGAEQGVGPGREDLQALVAADHLEEHACAFGAADPVALHQPDLLGPALELVERA
jgi:hypothetical protein